MTIAWALAGENTAWAQRRNEVPAACFRGGVVASTQATSSRQDPPARISLDGDDEGEAHMGCVWQSEHAPVPRLSDTRVHERRAARHRKPPRWRRAVWAAGPVLVAALARYRARPGAGKLAVLARQR
jgi:hypothetical protein